MKTNPPGSLRLIVRDRMERASVGIWLMVSDPATNRISHIAEPSSLVFKSSKNLGDAFRLPEPFLELDYHYAREFLQGLADGLSQLGYRANTDRLAGELEPTKAHLKREMELLDKVLKIHDRLLV